MHYYTFHPKDYISKTHFLEPMEDLAYRRMLDYIYLNECHLPDDIDDIAKKINMRTHTDSIANVLREFFELSDDGYMNDRAEQEIAKYQEKSEKARKSAQARWKKKPSKAKKGKGSSQNNANALQTDCEGNANHKPLTINHEPLTTNKENTKENIIKENTLNDNVKNDVIAFETFWEAYDKKIDRAKCEKKWKSLTAENIKLILENVDEYVSANNDKQYRKNPLTYLNGKCWLDEIIVRQTTATKIDRTTDKLAVNQKWSGANKSNIVAANTNVEDMFGASK